MGEIKYPATRTYWVARSEDGEFIQAGFTDPDQVTTSGQAVLVGGTRTVQIQEISQYKGSPEAFNYEWGGSGWVFPHDNHLYIPAAPHIAEPLSRSLYELVFPGESGLFAGVIPHPQQLGFPLLQFRSVDIVPIAIGANPQLLADVLQTTVDEEALTQEEADGIVAAVTAMAGQVVKIVDFIPPSWQPFVMTREQATAAGYFAEVAE